MLFRLNHTLCVHFSSLHLHQHLWQETSFISSREEAIHKHSSKFMQQQDAAMPCSGLPRWQEQFLQLQMDGFWSPPLSVHFDPRWISWSKYGPNSLFSAPEMSTNFANICIWSTMPERLFWSRGQLHLSFAYVKQGEYCKLETHVSGQPAVCQHHHAYVSTHWRAVIGGSAKHSWCMMCKCI